MTKEVRAWWEEAADYFQEELALEVGLNWTGFSADHLGLLDDVDGLDVLELGCGGGQCAVELAIRGANVTAVDFSRAQLSHAQTLASEHGVAIDFLQADVSDLGMLPGEGYDLAFNAWVFQWVADLAGCFEEALSVLRPGGRFLFSMPHPFYEVVNPETRGIDASYFDTGQHVADDGSDTPQITYHRTVSDIYNALVDAGFVVERILEPGTPDPSEYEVDPWGEYPPELASKVPTTLLVDARSS